MANKRRETYARTGKCLCLASGWVLHCCGGGGGVKEQLKKTITDLWVSSKHGRIRIQSKSRKNKHKSQLQIKLYKKS